MLRISTIQLIIMYDSGLRSSGTTMKPQNT